MPTVANGIDMVWNIADARAENLDNRRWRRDLFRHCQALQFFASVTVVGNHALAERLDLLA